jgi:hypothetical protein
MVHFRQQLQVQPQPGQRGAQLMRHVGGKQPLAIEGQIEAGNQLIQGGGHRRHFGHRFAER